MSANTRQEPRSRGRDLAVMTLEVVAASGGTRTFTSVMCPKELRSRPLEECSPCVDGRGPDRDLTGQSGFFECVALDGPQAQPGRQAADPAPSVADRTQVSKVMTRNVVAVRADLPLQGARALLLERDVSGVPVVDDEGRPIGILALADLVRAGAAALAPGARVGDTMLRRVLTVADTAPVSELAALMAFEGIHLAPVVSREGRVVGIVTALDLVRWVSAQDDRGARHLP